MRSRVMCRSTRDRAERHRGERDLQAALVAGVADRHAVPLPQGARSCAGSPPPAAAGRSRWRASAPAGRCRASRTARSISSIVDMPVERMTGLPVAASARSSSRSVTRRRGDLVRRRRRAPRGTPPTARPTARRTSAGRARAQYAAICRYSSWPNSTRRCTPGRSSRPTASARIWSRCSAGTQISGVRFWNFTAWQPGSAATSISRRAMSRSPLWLMPISPIT